MTSNRIRWVPLVALSLACLAGCNRGPKLRPCPAPCRSTARRSRTGTCFLPAENTALGRGGIWGGRASRAGSGGKNKISRVRPSNWHCSAYLTTTVSTAQRAALARHDHRACRALGVTPRAVSQHLRSLHHAGAGRAGPASPHRAVPGHRPGPGPARPAAAPSHRGTGPERHAMRDAGRVDRVARREVIAAIEHDGCAGHVGVEPAASARAVPR